MGNNVDDQSSAQEEIQNETEEVEVGRWKTAVAEQISANLAWLMGAARQIAPQGIDPEDLLSEAVAKLLALGTDSPPSIVSVRSYLASAMRNVAIDFTRSPRSRVVAHEDEFFLQIPQQEDPEEARRRAAELHGEFLLIRRAFGELDSEDQALLEKTLIEGRGPKDVAVETGLSAAAVSLRAFRAKAALKRQLLVQFLRAGSRDCVDNANKIAGEVFERLSDHSPRARGLKHVNDCDTCQINWRKFADVSKALGVTTILTLAFATERGNTTVAAAAPGVRDSTTGSEGNAGEARQEVAQTSASSIPGLADAATTTPGGSNLTSVARGQGSVGPVPAAAATAVSSRMARMMGVLSSKGAGITAIACLVAAGGGVVTHLLLDEDSRLVEVSERTQLTNDDQLDAQMATAASYEGELVSFAIDFDIRDADWWEVQELILTLPDRAELVSSPQNLACASGGARMECVATDENWSNGTFGVKIATDDAEALAAADANEAVARPIVQFAVSLGVKSVRGIEIRGEAKTIL